VIFQLRHVNCRWLWRYRSALTGSTNHDDSGSSNGTVLFGGPDWPSGWFAHRARERSTLTRLIASPPKAQMAFEKPHRNGLTKTVAKQLIGPS